MGVPVKNYLSTQIHTWVSTGVLIVLVVITGLIFRDRPLVTDDIPRALSTRATALTNITRFFGQCLPHMIPDETQEKSLGFLTGQQVENCSELLIPVGQVDTSSMKLELYTQKLLEARRLFAELVILERQIVQEDEATRSASLASESASLTSDLTQSLTAATVAQSDFFTQEEATINALIRRRWQRMLILTSLATSLIVVALFTHYQEREHEGSFFAVKIGMLAIYGLFLGVQIAHKLSQTPEVIAEGELVRVPVRVSVNTGPQASEPISVSDIPAQTVVGKEWSITNDGSQPGRLELRLGELVNHENGCKLGERSVDDTCGPNEGELGQFIEGQMAFNFNGSLVPFASFTLDDDAPQTFQSNWQSFIQLAGGFRALGFSSDILYPGETRVIRYEWFLPQLPSNAAQSDSVDFQLFFNLTELVEGPEY